MMTTQNTTLKPHTSSNTYHNVLNSPNSTGYEIPSDPWDITGKLSWIENKIPDIGMTSCHAEKYNLNAKLEATEMRQKKKKKEKHGKTSTITKKFPSQKPWNFMEFVVFLKLHFCNNTHKNIAVLRK